jgi:hypothetical protein
LRLWLIDTEKKYFLPRGKDAKLGKFEARKRRRGPKQIPKIRQESTKSEARNPKQIQMTKTNTMFQTARIRIRGFGFSGFGIYLAGVCFGPWGRFGASDFGFSNE